MTWVAMRGSSRNSRLKLLVKLEKMCSTTGYLVARSVLHHFPPCHALTDRCTITEQLSPYHQLLLHKRVLAATDQNLPKGSSLYCSAILCDQSSVGSELHQILSCTTWLTTDDWLEGPVITTALC